MADGLNKVMLLWNLGADPELKMTSGGQAVLKLRLATAESYLDRSKQRQERTEWHSVVLWGKCAESLSRILPKGSRLFVEGSIRTSSYDDKDGGGKSEGGGSGGGTRGGGQASGGGGAGASDEPADDFDSDIPF